MANTRNGDSDRRRSPQSARRRPGDPTQTPRRRPEGAAQNTTRRRPESTAQQPARRKPSGAAGRRPPKKENTPQRRRRGSILLRLVTMLVVVAVFVFGLAIFFKVTEIQVTGNSVYTAQEVVDASGLQIGDNLVTISKGSVVGKILAKLPYVEEISMERVLPGTVVIHVVESDVIYTVDGDDGGTWLMNGSGKILAKADAAADYPHLSGVTAQAPEIGSQIASEQTENLTAALELLPLLEQTEYISQVTEVRVDKTYDIVVLYGDTYEIHLGGTEQLEYKMQYLAAILDEPQVAEGGIIDLSLEESSVAVFKPWSTQTTATAADETSGDDGAEADDEDPTAETDSETDSAAAENSDGNS